MNNVKIGLNVIGQNGTVEITVDNGGVLNGPREFYETSYLKCCTNYRMPVISHYMDADEWGAVAKVIAITWRQDNVLIIGLRILIMGRHNTKAASYHCSWHWMCHTRNGLQMLWSDS